MLLAVLVGCKEKEDPTLIGKVDSGYHSAYHYKVESLHNHYRTLWYRSSLKLYGDSCQKYGLLLDKIFNIKEEDIMKVDTIPQP